MRQVGSGKITVTAIANRMQPEEMRPVAPSVAGRVEAELQAEESAKAARSLPRRKKAVKRENAIVVDGVDDMLMKVSKCCMPVPGDDIVGFITSGRGISVHKVGCANFLATDPERHIEVSWAAETSAGHQVQIQVVAQDQKGLISSVSSTINEVDADIVSMEARTSSENLAIVNLVLEVESLVHLDKVLLQLRRVGGVIEAHRK